LDIGQKRWERGGTGQKYNGTRGKSGQGDRHLVPNLKKSENGTRNLSPRPLRPGWGLFFGFRMLDYKRFSSLFKRGEKPIMGYGISPIVGYMIAVTWIKKNM